MSDLHAKLLAQLGDRFDNYAVEVDRRGAALRAVVEPHAPKDTYPFSTTPIGYIACTGCDAEGYEWDHPAYPCSTIQAIARELGVPTEGDDRG